MINDIYKFLHSDVHIYNILYFILLLFNNLMDNEMKKYQPL